MATINDKLKKYELAALAESKIKEKAEYSLLAMQEFYKSMGVDAEDPIVNRALQEASRGIGEGQITNSGVYEAIGIYSNKYNEALVNGTVAEFLDYAKDKGYDIPETVAPALESYKGKTIKEIYTESKKETVDAAKKAAKRVWNAISLIKEYVMESLILPDLVKYRTDSGLEALLVPEGNR